MPVAARRSKTNKIFILIAAHEHFRDEAAMVLLRVLIQAFKDA